MKQNDLTLIARLRLIVGYLGEQKQFSWWTSSFLSKEAPAFLSPIFGKTLLLAQYNGVKEAAAKVHDAHIGIGRGVYHLFRLPELYEQQLHSFVSSNEEFKQINLDIVDVTTAMNSLKAFCDKSVQTSLGPVGVGSFSDIEQKNTWQDIAGHYAQAFETNIKVFPFFSEEK